MAVGRSASSQKWLKEHFNDVYVKEAWAQGYRARSAFKLLEIQQKYKILKPGMTVIDLGAAPGGWSQIAVEAVGRKGRVIAFDRLTIAPIEGVEVVQGDFTEDNSYQELLTLMGGDLASVVLSDMAPNAMGIKAVDQLRAIHLCELAFEFAKTILVRDGSLLIKVFQGLGFDDLLAALRKDFTKVQVIKPKASRERSTEVYLLARGLSI